MTRGRRRPAGYSPSRPEAREQRCPGTPLAALRAHAGFPGVRALRAIYYQICEGVSWIVCSDVAATGW